KMSGGKKLEQIELENTKAGERRVVRTPAVFSMIGAVPCTEWLPPEIERDEKGFIKTGADVASAPAWKIKLQPTPLETSLPGIFAAGDVRSGSIKRCAADVGEGGMAVAGIHLALVSNAAQQYVAIAQQIATPINTRGPPGTRLSLPSNPASACCTAIPTKRFANTNHRCAAKIPRAQSCHS